MALKGIYYKALNIWGKVKFHANENAGSLYDRLLQTLGVKDTSMVFSASPKPVLLFIGKEANFRVLKIAKWLHSTGRFRLVLALHHTSIFNHSNNPFFDEVIRYRNGVHLKRLAALSNAPVLYAFTSAPGYAEIAMKNFKGKKVFDAYDCLVVYYGLNPHLRWMKNEVPAEGACFRLADYVCARNLESAESMRMYGLPAPPNIVFSDYCDNDSFSLNQKGALTPDSEIHLVYSGGLYGRSARASSHGIENFDEVVEALTPNRIHWHLYPTPFAPLSYYHDFIEDAKRIEFLHIYPSVSQAKLGVELSRYHFGILPHFKDPSSSILPAKLKYGTSNKFFNFLEAGLPIIVSAEMTYMAWLVKRYNIGIVIERSDLKMLRNKIVAADYEALQRNVLQVRDKLGMKNNLPRLVRFFERMV